MRSVYAWLPINTFALEILRLKILNAIKRKLVSVYEIIFHVGAMNFFPVLFSVTHPSENIFDVVVLISEILPNKKIFIMYTAINKGNVRRTSNVYLKSTSSSW